MLAIQNLLKDRATGEVISALYYVARYIKQADQFVELEKDIFEDEQKSAPSLEVRSLALAIIDQIEKNEGAKATEFDDETVIRLLRQLSDIEDSLEPEYSDENIRAAGLALDTMVLPHIQSKLLKN